MGPKPKAPPPPPAMDPKEFEIKMEIQMMKDHVLSVDKDMDHVVNEVHRATDDLSVRIRSENEVCNRLEAEIQEKENTIRQQDRQLLKLKSQLEENEKAFEANWRKQMSESDEKVAKLSLSISIADKYIAEKSHTDAYIVDLESKIKNAENEKKEAVLTAERRALLDLSCLRDEWKRLFEQRQNALHVEAKRSLDQVTINENEVLMAEIKLLSTECTRLMEINNSLTEVTTNQKRDAKMLEEALQIAHKKAINARNEANLLKEREENSQKIQLGLSRKIQTNSQSPSNTSTVKKGQFSPILRIDDNDVEQSLELLQKATNENTVLKENLKDIEKQVSELKNEKAELTSSTVKAQGELQHYMNEHEALSRLQDHGAKLLLSFLDSARAHTFVYKNNMRNSIISDSSMLNNNQNNSNFNGSNELDVWGSKMFGLSPAEIRESRERFGIKTVEQRDLFLSILLKKIDDTMCASCRVVGGPLQEPDVRKLLLLRLSGRDDDIAQKYDKKINSNTGMNIQKQIGKVNNLISPGDYVVGSSSSDNTMFFGGNVNLSVESECVSIGIQTDSGGELNLPLNYNTALKGYNVLPFGSSLNAAFVQNGSISPQNQEYQQQHMVNMLMNDKFTGAGRRQRNSALTPLKLPPEHKLPSFVSAYQQQQQQQLQNMNLNIHNNTNKIGNVRLKMTNTDGVIATIARDPSPPPHSLSFISEVNKDNKFSQNNNTKKNYNTITNASSSSQNNAVIPHYPSSSRSSKLRHEATLPSQQQPNVTSPRNLTILVDKSARESTKSNTKHENLSSKQGIEAFNNSFSSSSSAFRMQSNE